MSLLLASLLSALIPVGVEGIKQVIATKLGGAKPLSVDDQIKLDKHEIEKLQALAALDTPGGTPSQWIVDLRASSRYLACWACIAIGTYMLSIPAQAVTGAELISIAFGFLFGTRLVISGPRK